MIPPGFRFFLAKLRSWFGVSPAEGAGFLAAGGVVVVLSVFLFPFLWKPWIHGNDGVRHYAYCRSLCLDFDLDFTNEFDHYARAGELEEIHLDPRTGKPGNGHGIGSGLLWIPFFLAGHLAAWALGFPLDGYSSPYVWAVSFGTTFYAVLGLLLLTRILSQRFTPSAALLAVLGIWLGTPLVFYMYLHPSMSHGCSFFLSTLLFWQYMRWRNRRLPAHFFLLGLTAGLAAATRINDAILVFVPGAFWLKIAVSGPPFHAKWRRLLQTGLACAAGVFIGFLPQMAAWRFFYGQWLSGPRDFGLNENLRLWASPYFFHLFFSGWRGLFVWSPVLIPAALGLAMLLRRKRFLDVAAAAAILAQAWVIGGWASWYGGASFGPRFFINLLPAFAMGLAWLFLCLRAGALRKWLAAMVVLCLLWNAGLAVQYISGMIDRKEKITLREIASNQVFHVPQWTAAHLRLLRPKDRIEAPSHP